TSGSWTCGSSASTSDETDFAFRNLPKRFDHEFLLSRPYSGLQIVEGIAPTHRHPALTHDGAGVVVGIDQMHRQTRFRLAGLEHCLEHPIPIHPRSAESRQQGRVSVEDSARESPEDE